MADQMIISLPSRVWAECAVRDFIAAGCCARLLPEPDARGWAQIVVSGSREEVEALRRLAAPITAGPTFAWEGFINGLSGLYR